jgi:hypothetical protein
MDLESHAIFAQLPDHVKPAWLRAIRALFPIWLVVVEMISELLAPAELRGKLSSYINLPERLGWPASDRNRMHPLL